jgi:hypothetical protein
VGFWAEAEFFVINPYSAFSSVMALNFINLIGNGAASHRFLDESSAFSCHLF